MFPGIKIWLLVEKEYDISKMFRSFFESAKVNLDLDRFQAVYKCWIIYEIQFSLLKFKRLKYCTYQKNSGPLFLENSAPLSEHRKQRSPNGWNGKQNRQRRRNFRKEQGKWSRAPLASLPAKSKQYGGTSPTRTLAAPSGR